VLARLGGDEFAVLLPLTTLVGADSLVASLEAELERRPVTVGEAEVRAQASIGVAALEGDLDVDGALRLADEAMYRVKHARRDM
jgi:diguanylate cyclase (GGDEF)-like protein